MKLVFAIVNNEDGNLVMRELNKAGFSVTKMASTGGFLRAGNTTLLVGTEEDQVQNAMDIIAKHSMKRKQIMFTPEPFIGVAGSDYSSYPEEIETGGATIFVVDVERFEKV
ncbi:MAG: cyclic-di-AMP receptor [Clostridia bacterium]|nr:cyclic-di-AMP receptor [Clostridia bacterium]